MPHNGRRLGAGGGFTAVCTGGKFPNPDKTFCEGTPPLEPNRLLCGRSFYYIYFISNF